MGSDDANGGTREYGSQGCVTTPSSTASTTTERPTMNENEDVTTRTAERTTKPDSGNTSEASACPSCDGRGGFTFSPMERDEPNQKCLVCNGSGVKQKTQAELAIEYAKQESDRDKYGVALEEIREICDVWREDPLTEIAAALKAVGK